MAPMPFLLVFGIALVILSVFPQIALWIPSKM
jgi:TRAP-type C4-dicarboxylate transport system permease large subunit